MEEFEEPTGDEEEEWDEEELDSLEELEEMDLVGEVGTGSEEERTPSAATPEEPPEILEYAAKVYAMELVSGEFIKGSGSGRSWLRMWNGDDLDKARVMGTIVQSFLSNDGTYCALTVDDGTETVRVKGWRDDAKRMSAFQPGEIVDVIGQVREYNGEVYLSPMSITAIEDPNWEALRELEIYRLRKVKKNDLQL